MGFWRKLGKIALLAAPYIAAPFTGGLSLMATGAANKAVQKWNEKNAISDAAKGLAPSKFDKIIGKVGTASTIASSFIPTNAFGAVGALGKLGSGASKLGSVGSQVANTAGKIGGTAQKMSGFANTLKGIGQGAAGMGSGWQGALGSTLGKFGMSAAENAISNAGGNQDYQQSGLGPSAIPGNISSGGIMPEGGYSYEQNPLNQVNQNNPNLAQSIFQGRQDALKRRAPSYRTPTLVPSGY